MPSFCFCFCSCPLLFLPLCLWTQIYVFSACGCSIFVVSLFCCKGSRNQAMYFFLFLLLCFWARIHVLLVPGCCICVASLFCHKDSRIQAIYWHKMHVSMLTVTSCPMFWYEKCSPSCLIFGVIICSENGRTQF
jgi:hypothetical protein